MVGFPHSFHEVLTIIMNSMRDTKHLVFLMYVSPLSSSILWMT